MAHTAHSRISRHPRHLPTPSAHKCLWTNRWLKKFGSAVLLFSLVILIMWGLSWSDKTLFVLPQWGGYVGLLVGGGTAFYFAHRLSTMLSFWKRMLICLISLPVGGTLGLLFWIMIGAMLSLFNAKWPHKKENRQHIALCLNRRHTPSKRYQRERYDLQLDVLDMNFFFDYNSKSDYLRIHPGDTCTLHTHIGALGFEIIDSLCPPQHPTPSLLYKHSLCPSAPSLLPAKNNF